MDTTESSEEELIYPPGALAHTPPPSRESLSASSAVSSVKKVPKDLTW